MTLPVINLHKQYDPTLPKPTESEKSKKEHLLIHAILKPSLKNLKQNGTPLRTKLLKSPMYTCQGNYLNLKTKTIAT